MNSETVLEENKEVIEVEDPETRNPFYQSFGFLE